MPLRECARGGRGAGQKSRAALLLAATTGTREAFSEPARPGLEARCQPEPPHLSALFVQPAAQTPWPPFRSASAPTHFSAGHHWQYDPLPPMNGEEARQPEHDVCLWQPNIACSAPPSASPPTDSSAALWDRKPSAVPASDDRKQTASACQAAAADAMGADERSPALQISKTTGGVLRRCCASCLA